MNCGGIEFRLFREIEVGDTFFLYDDSLQNKYKIECVKTPIAVTENRKNKYRQKCNAIVTRAPDGYEVKKGTFLYLNNNHLVL